MKLSGNLGLPVIFRLELNPPSCGQTRIVRLLAIGDGVYR
jgi:hypothetical protein